MMAGEKNELGEDSACEVFCKGTLCFPVISIKHLGEFKQMLHKIISDQ
jgi:hypothetical protein